VDAPALFLAGANCMHEVEALVARSEPLADGVRHLARAVLCPLAQNFSLLPITDALAGELATASADSSTPPKPLPYLPDGLHALALDISRRTPVAYIMTSYFGGHGRQDALAWDKGELRFSPTANGYDQPWPHTPISQALRMIGVVADVGLDEFDSVGLGRHRETHRWADSVA
jgi:hypothetical protein